MWGVSGYGPGFCSAQVAKPGLINVFVDRESLRIEALSPGETLVDIECRGDGAGEYALCNAPYRNFGSITVKVVQAVKRPAG